MRLFAALLILALAPAPVFASAAADSLRRRAEIGAVLRPPSASRAGAEVVRVADGSPVARAGLRAGDRVVKINGTLLDGPVALESVTGALRGGDAVRLEVARDGEIVELRATLEPAPLESMPEVETVYGSVLSAQGHRLRTIVTRPKGASGRLPGLLLVAWLSCDTVEVPEGASRGSDRLLRGLVARSGYAVMRVERPGLGDSEGPPCVTSDFHADLEGYRAALRAFRRHEFVDPDRVYLLGMSNGGGVAPLVAAGDPEEKVAGYIVSGGWVKTWLEHMLEHERRRLALSGRAAGEVTASMRGYAEFYDRYLNGRMTPGEVARERPHLAGLWYDGPEHQYGRPAAFYHQLQALDLAGAWEKVDVPTLVVYGEHDWVMSRDDHLMIADFVNRRRPGAARYVEVPKMDHFYRAHDTAEASFRNAPGSRFPEEVLDVMLEWLREQNRER